MMALNVSVNHGLPSSLPLSGWFPQSCTASLSTGGLRGDCLEERDKHGEAQSDMHVARQLSTYYRI